jgi:hypothetical protein
MATARVDDSYPFAGTLKAYVGQITMSNSYTTGGEVIDLPGNERIAVLLAQSAAGRGFDFDPVTQKLKAYSTAATEVTAATDLSASRVGFVAFGA